MAEPTTTLAEKYWAHFRKAVPRPHPATEISTMEFGDWT
jgi:hypothetical protein